MENTGYRAELITDIRTLENHRDPYQKFCEQLPSQDAFTYHLDWVIAHHHQYIRNNVQFFWILLWQKIDPTDAQSTEEIVAVAPLQKETLNASRLGLRRLRVWGDDNGYAHNTQPTILLKQADVKNSESGATNTVQHHLLFLIQYLKTTLRYQWDEMFIHRIKSSNTHLQIFSDLASEKCHASLTKEPSSDITFSFAAPDFIEDIIRGESKRKIKKGLANLQKDYSSVELKCHNQVSDELYASMVELHTQRQFSANQQGAQRNSFFNNPIENQTIKNEIRVASKKNQLRLYTLEVDNKLIAFLLCYHQDDWTFAHITAFDDRFKHYKAARVLWFHAFTEERKTYQSQLIDTGWGGNQFKQAFSNKTEPLYAIRISNQQSLRSKLVTQSLNAPRKLKQLLKKAG